MCFSATSASFRASDRHFGQWEKLGNLRFADETPGIALNDGNGKLLRAQRQRTTFSIGRRGLACAVHFG
jgi:hypothetical protein